MNEEKIISKQDGKTCIPKRGLVATGATIDADVLNWQYEGTGTTEDPYIVEWITNDSGNPLFWKSWYKWLIALSVASTTLCVSFCSSAYSGGKPPRKIFFLVYQLPLLRITCPELTLYHRC